MRTDHLIKLLGEIESEVESVDENFKSFEVWYDDLTAKLDVTTVWDSEGDDISDPRLTYIVHQRIENVEFFDGPDLDKAEFTDDQQTIINEYLAKWTI